MTTTTQSIKPFDGSNYDNWEFRLRLLLEHHEVLEMLSTEAPTDPTQLTAFKKKDLKARNLIVNCLSDTVLVMIKDKTTARDIISELKGTYAKCGIANQVMLQRKLRNLKFRRSSGSLNDFLVDFEKTISELKGVWWTSFRE